MLHHQRLHPSHRTYMALALACLIGLAICPSGFTGRTVVRQSTDKGEQSFGASDTEKVAATFGSPRRNRLTKLRGTGSPSELASGATTEPTQGIGYLVSREPTPDALALQVDTPGESGHTDVLGSAIGATPAENFTLSATPYAAALAVYEGYLDSAACDKVYGWAWDKNLPNSPINVDIFDGGSFLQTVPANEYRVDLPGNKYHGFSYIPSASLKDGRTHNIYARFSGTSTYLTNSPKSLTCAPPAPTISGYSWNTTPKANQPFGGTITGTNFISGIRIFFCVSGTSTCYEHPSAGVSLNNSSSLSVSSVNLGSGSYQVYVQTTGGQSARSSSFAVQSAPQPPTISGYSWNTTPTANQSFAGTITGANFVSGIRVFFCINGTSTCYEHPAAGISLNSSTSLSVSSVNLNSGSYQIYVQTSAGQSARSTAFTVQAAVPTITSYSWNTTLTANQPFGGTITGTNFISGIRVFFCANGTSTCYEHPSAGISVNSSTSLTVSSVNLGGGSYQLYVQTSAGQSSRSSAFTVQSALPMITNYSWNTMPTANQTFSGTISGTGFAAGIRVFFCVNGTGTCFEHPSAGIVVNSSTSLSVSSVNLGGGSYQFYVQTTAGQSSRSSAFTVQSAPSLPTVSGYSWTSTPTANQPFGGTIAGANFVSGIRLFFCVAGTNSCYEHPSAGITVNGSTSLSVVNVNVGAGSYEIYVQTSTGQSARSSAFNVQGAANAPAISGYNWNTPPAANQPFSGVIMGTGFVSGTQVFFCVNGTNTCYQHPSVGVIVNSAASINVNNVSLDGGSWQIYVQAGSGQSPRSAAFTVQGGTSETASFVSETILDGTRVAPGQNFTKTWTIRNSGTTTWNSTYRLRWVSGSTLSNHADTPVGATVQPGGTYTFSVAMTAPSSGNHREDWKLINGGGSTIKIGNSNSVWVSITVNGGTDAATFVGETVPDGTTLSPRQSFTKTWTIRNSGATTWGSGYKLRWISSPWGSLSAHSDVPLTGQVAPGGTYTFSVPMTAPGTPGSYREEWQFINLKGGTIQIGTSPTVWADINVGGTPQSQCGTAAQMRDRIQQRIQANNYVLTYQPSQSDVEALLSLNLQAYDELYFSALRYRSLVQTTFLLARKFVDQGNLDAGCNYMRRADKTFSLRTQIEGAAALVWDTRVSGAQEVVAKVISTTCSIEATLIGARFGNTAGSIADGLCIAADYAVDKSIYGQEEAFKRLASNIRTAVISKVLNIELGDLDGQTIAQWVSKGGFKYDTGQSMINNLLKKALQKSGSRAVIRDALAALGDAAINVKLDYYTDLLINNYLDALSGGAQVNSPQGAANALSDSTASALPQAETEGAPQVLSTSPARSATLVAAGSANIEIVYDEPVQPGSLLITMKDAGGSTVALSNIAVQNNVLRAVTATQLKLRGAYTVTVHAGAVNNAAGVQNDECQWSFVTVPPSLSIGSNVKVANTGGVGLSLRSTPRFLADGSNVIGVLPEGARLRIMGGSQAGDGYTWWNVTGNGETGWAAVGDWVVPNDQSGIRIGAQATVSNTAGVGLQLRDEPGMSGGVITTLPEGTPVTVMSGPYLVDGYVWWNLKGDAGTGFSPTAYWLLPDLASATSVSSLTVTSSNADGHESILVTPADVNGLGNGTTQFTRTYASNALVTLTAPVTSGGGTFTGWQLDSTDWSSNRTVSVTADANHTLTAVYAEAKTAVQFSHSSFSASENSGRAVVTVTRTGDLAATCSVDYETSDGTADHRADYTISVGTIRFAPGEASKTFEVLLTNDSFVEGGETIKITLSNPTAGIPLGSASSATLTILDDDVASSGVNPIDDGQFYVRQHYHDFLSREPDTLGLQFWTNEIDMCGAAQQCKEVKRINVSAAFFLSIEFQNTGYLIYRMYKAAYGDATSPNVPGTVPVVRLQDFLPDSQRIGQGVVVGQGTWEQQLETNKAAFALEFVQRQRFLTANPLTMTPGQFVDRLNQNAGGVLTQHERDQLVAELSAAPDVRVGRASVLRKVAENQSLQRNEFNRAFVLMQYFGYMRRNPDDPQDTDFRGWKFWLDKLNQFGGNFVQAEMVKAFLDSTEYRRRFGQ